MKILKKLQSKLQAKKDKKLSSKKLDNNKKKPAVTADLKSPAILKKQIVRLSGICIFVMIVVWLLSEMASKSDESDKSTEDNPEEGLSKYEIDLPDKALDSEIYWRNYFEEDMGKNRSDTKSMIEELKEYQDSTISEIKSDMNEMLDKVRKSIENQNSEYEQRNNELKRMLEDQRLAMDNHSDMGGLSIDEMAFESDIEFDDPKSASEYIPEGTYFSGYLLGGVVVSTALNTADEHASPVIIRLTGRGNLDDSNKLDISNCRIMGSSYGDLSSERAVIRLEKMICKSDEVYVTSDIAGIVYGDDGFNGIKGTVVSTSTKHLKNAAIGGLISGLSSAAKGQDGMSIGAGGLISSQSKGAMDLLKSGGMTGMANVGEKLADYYLRQAESMSPVLTIPAGVRVNTQITRGFFVGERGTRRKIRRDRNLFNAGD